MTDQVIETSRDNTSGDQSFRSRLDKCLTGPSFCTTASERDYILAMGCELVIVSSTLEPAFLYPYNSSEPRTISPMQLFAGHNPLTDSEFERLDAFLDNTKNSRAMNLEQIDGFFTALVCGPEVVMPGEYLPYVWGNEKSLDGVFENLEEAQEILGLLNRHWNTIAKTLYQEGCTCRSCTKTRMGR